MKIKHLWIGLLLLLSLVVAACGGTVAAPETGMEKEMAGTPVAPGGSVETMDKEGETAMAGDPVAGATDTMSDKEPEATAESTPGSEAKVVADPVKSEPTAEGNTGGEAETGTASTDEPAPDTAKVAGVDLPAWFSAELVDVRSGEAFVLADLQGQVVLVETMAIWCSNCLKQQKQVKALHEALGDRPDLVTVVLDIDPNENAENLKAYADKNGFHWTYAVAPRAVAREIGQLYGDQFLNPPSTPMLIIDRHGEAHPLPFGIKSAASLEKALQPFLSDSP